MQKYNMEIGRIIKKIRKSKGLTRLEVVSNLDITEAYLCAIENGKRTPDIPKKEDGTLNIKESLYYKILTKGLSKSPYEAERIVLDWKLDELGVDDKSLKEPLKDLIEGNLSLQSKKAILATYFGVKLQDKTLDYAGKDNYQKITDSVKEKVFVKQAAQTLKQAKDRFKELAGGRFDTHPENYYDAIDIIRYAEDYLHCTSYVDNRRWWRSGTGRKYLEANKEAVERGVEIVRIFILKKDELESCQKVLKEQQNAGIDVCVAYEKDLPDNLLADFILQDGKILFKNDIKDGKIRRNIVSISEEDIRWAKQTFSKLKQHAKKFRTQ